MIVCCIRRLNMSEELNLDAYITSPFASDLKKQRDAAYNSARNIRKVTETPEEYRIRLAQQEQQHLEELRSENTDVLHKRLASLDISNIGTKNRIAIEQMIRDAEAIRFFALYNHYDMSAMDFTTLDNAVKAAKLRLESLKKGENKTHFGNDIYADTYVKAQKEKDNVLTKLLNNTSKNSDYNSLRKI